MILELSDIVNSHEVNELKRAILYYDSHPKDGSIAHRCADDSLHCAKMRLADQFEKWIRDELI